jgi:hypothetical protein
MKNNTIHGLLTSFLTFSTCSNLFECGRDEDGSELIGSHHYVVATSLGGRRFLRIVGSSSWLCVYDDDGEPVYSRTADPVELNNRADAIAEKLNTTSSPNLNPDNWYETEAVYGSDAFVLAEERDAALMNNFRDLEFA